MFLLSQKLWRVWDFAYFQGKNLSCPILIYIFWQKNARPLGQRNNSFNTHVKMKQPEKYLAPVPHIPGPTGQYHEDQMFTCICGWLCHKRGTLKFETWNLHKVGNVPMLQSGNREREALSLLWNVNRFCLGR